MAQNPIAIALSAAEADLLAGRWQTARTQAQRFVHHNEYGIRARGVVANAATQMGDFAEAAAQLRYLLEALPSNQGIRTALSVTLNNLGSTAMQGDSISEAEACYREALTVDQHNSLAWFNLAVCLQKRNDYAQAARAYSHCTKLEPSRFEARLQWAICERICGAQDEAQKVLAGFDEAGLDARLLIQLGAEWDLLGEQAVAARTYARAARISDGDAGVILRIAQAQLSSGDMSAARISGHRAISQSDNDGISLKASLIVALGLPAIPDGDAEIDQARNNFADGITMLEAEWPVERLQASGVSLDELAHSHYLLAYQGRDDTELAKAFGHWYCAAASAIVTGKNKLDLTPGHTNRRRVALVSARWNIGTIGAYFGSWIDAFVNAGWDVHVFHIGSNVDEWTSSIAHRATEFHHLPGPLGNTVALIQETAPAVIIYPEVGLSPRIHALAALRLAPTQAAAWGHPVSTGLRSIDVYISCARMEPVDAVDQYQEQLLLLPHLGTNYRRPNPATAIPRLSLGLPEDHPVYLAPHDAVKLHSGFDDLLAGIAHLDPEARFVMFENSSPILTKRLRRRMKRRFDQQGIDIDRHMIWLPKAPLATFRSVLGASNVLLDTPGFSGGNTSLDAIGQALPLITLPGAGMRSRQSAAMLRMCGAEELIASTPEDFIERAIHVARDVSYASDMRQQLYEAGATLFDDQRPLETLVEWIEPLG